MHRRKESCNTCGPDNIEAIRENVTTRRIESGRKKARLYFLTVKAWNKGRGRTIYQEGGKMGIKSDTF